MRKHAALVASALVVFVTGGVTIASADSGTGSTSGPAGRLSGSAAPAIAPDDIETYISPSVILRYWLANPEQAPAMLRTPLRRVKALAAVTHRLPAPPRAAGPGVLGDVFNLDASGLPQNEESVAVCHSNPQVVLGGTNDFRRAFELGAGITGWHLSLDGGRNLANEGLLPPLAVNGATRPSNGDPVVATSPACRLYAGSLNQNPEDPFDGSSGIGVYRTTPARLASCPGGSATSCWPTRRVVATAPRGHMLDKEWLDVGPSGASGTVVWVVFADVKVDPSSGRETSSLKAVRCGTTLARCTSPVLISGSDRHAQLGDVTIGPDGRVYVTWSSLLNIEQFDPAHPPQVIHKLRVAGPGGTRFGPPRVIDRERRPIFNFKLHANDFRVPPYAKNTVRIVAGRPRVFLIWEGCQARPFGFACEEPAIKLRYSDDLGASWSRTTVLSAGGDNYFPTIANDPAGPRLAAAWYTNRFDPRWHHRQDVELVGVDPATATVASRQRVTPFSNEPDADPSPFTANPGFIGDYIEAAAQGGSCFLHYNMNYRKEAFLGQGFPVNQQDNYLSKRRI
jgi:hypothetical protein